jgi:hypothetical protein
MLDRKCIVGKLEDVTSCSLVHRFSSTTLQIETAGSSETLLRSYQNIRHHIPEYGNLKINSSEDGGDVILLQKMQLSLSTTREHTGEKKYSSTYS